MKVLAIILLSPFLAATGFYPKYLLSENPYFSFRFYSFFFLLSSFFQQVLSRPPNGNPYLVSFLTTVGLYFLILSCFRPKWQVAIMMAWIGTDLVYFFTGTSVVYFDFVLLGIYLLRDLNENFKLKSK